MITNLPTTPGPYYWRESDGDEWEQIREVYPHADLELAVMDEGDECTPQQIGGQWLPIPPAEELVELQAIKKMVDEGQEMFGNFYPNGKICSVSESKSAMEARGLFVGHTCEPVTIIRKAKR